jgi:hypothetical protein
MAGSARVLFILEPLERCEGAAVVRKVVDIFTGILVRLLAKPLWHSAHNASNGAQRLSSLNGWNLLHHWLDNDSTIQT